MRDGPGRYATIGDSPVVRSFFADSSLKPGEKYTYKKLYEERYPNLKGFTVYQHQYGSDTDDYLERVYVWQSTGFTLNEDAIFEVRADGSKTINNVKLIPLDDDFDFNGGKFFKFW